MGTALGMGAACRPAGAAPGGWARRGAARRPAHTGRRRWLVAIAAALAAAELLSPPPAPAQGVGDELVVLGANAALGGATAGVVAAIRGEPVIGAVVKGTAGGLMIYGGKHLAAMYALAPLGFTGRVVASIGSSVIRNGAAGRGAFETVVVPLGPITYHYTAEPDSLHAPIKVNLLRTVVLAALIIDGRTEFDLEETMHFGAPVFRMPGRLVRVNGDRAVIGLAFAGSMVLSDREALRRTFGKDEYPHLVAHERIHVLQDAFVEIALTGPVEHWLLGLLPHGRTIARYVEVGAVHAAAAAPLLSTVIPYDRRPWEREADHFADRYHDWNARWSAGPAAALEP